MKHTAHDRAQRRLSGYLGAFRRRLEWLVLAERGLFLMSGGLALLALALLGADRGLLHGAALPAVRMVILAYALGGLACLGAASVGVRRQTLSVLARRIEAMRPALQGRLAAAAWLLEDPGSGAPDYMARRCVEDAARALGALPRPPRPATVNLRRRVVLAVLTVFGLLAAHLIAPQRLDAAWGTLGGEPAPSGFVALSQDEATRLAGAEIRYVFPRYTGLPPAGAHGPGDLTALAGTMAHVRFRLIGRAHGVRAFTHDGNVLPARVSVDGRQVLVDVPVTADGGYGVALLSPEQQESSRQLFRIHARPDTAPVVRLTGPGEDLEMIRPGGVLDVAGIASDDFAVTQVELRFLVTAGSGETYRFEEGVVPLTGHEKAGQIHVQAELDVGALLGGESDHGGVVSYHLEASDANGGSGLSETFLVRVAGDESVPLDLGGLVLPVGENRISQRQILEETRRLHARRAQMKVADVLDEARALAEKESDLRASFAGLSEQGGEWGHDEEDGGDVLGIAGVEAHLHSSEALPYSPAVLEALNKAIDAMFRAELFLHLGETDKAMPPMLEVIGFLQQARKHDRLMFRALPVAVSLDPAARGAGDLDDVEGPQPEQRREEGPDERAALLESLRLAVHSSLPVTAEQLQEWSHRAFALPEGMAVASALARAAGSPATRGDELRRATGLLALLLQGPENSPAAVGSAAEPLADHYFLSLAGEDAP